MAYRIGDGEQNPASGRELTGLEGAQDTPPARPGALDVLAQQLGVACGAPFHPDALYAEVTSAAPYHDLPRETFDQVLQFVATGG